METQVNHFKTSYSIALLTGQKKYLRQEILSEIQISLGEYSNSLQNFVNITTGTTGVGYQFQS
jgi:hypothetical protein